MSETTRIDRRRVLQAGAWTVPAISVAAAAPALAASPAARAVTGTLEWGVKRSFRNYIVNLLTSWAPGTITLSGGVTQVGGDDGIFVWPGGEGTVAEDGTVTVQYAGTVNFWKHDGALDVTISNPLLTVTPAGTGTMTVDFTSTDGTSSTLILADLSSVNVVDGAAVVVSNGDVATDADSTVTTLAETGVDVFAGATAPGQDPTPFYGAGDPMNAFTTTLVDA